jgi:hypothetical protein
MQPRDLVFFRLDKAVARILDGFPEDCKIQRVLIILNVEFFRNGVDIGRYNPGKFETAFKTCPAQAVQVMPVTSKLFSIIQNLR